MTDLLTEKEFFKDLNPYKSKIEREAKVKAYINALNGLIVQLSFELLGGTTTMPVLLGVQKAIDTVIARAIFDVVKDKKTN